ncbi:MAG: class I SAM-dependent methyltransferase [Spirochaetes bacterium]|nr:class I SAM-dependent methyltransferase [Spirochaetota bacterium]
MIRWTVIGILSVVALAALLSLTLFRDRIKATFYIDHMEREERISRMHVDRIVARLGISPGDVVADIGAGSGLFARRFAPLVAPSGRVYAADVNRDLLAHIDSESARRGIPGVTTVVASEDDPRLPAPVDLVFMCDTLHYIDGQEAYVKRMAGYVKRGGRIAIVSFRKNWPPMANRFTEEDLARWMERAGLSLQKTDDFIQDEYLAIYRKHD